MAAEDTTSPDNNLSAASCADRSLCACHADQDSLGRAFADDPDPHVRIIAHMSNRQLALSEQVGDLTRGIFKVAGAVHTLQEQSASTTGELRGLRGEVAALTKEVSKLVEVVGLLVSKEPPLSADIDSSSDVGASIPPV